MDYQEADTVVTHWKSIMEKAGKISKDAAEVSRDAFFELILHPTKASRL